MGILKNLFKQFGGGGGPPMQPPTGGQGPLFDEDFSEFVNKEYTERQAERKVHELQWRLNSEFLDGNQYLDIDPVSNSIQEIPKLFWWTNREVFNQLGTISATRIAKLGRQKPSIKTRPASSDDKDVSAAKISSMLLQSTWQDQLMDEQYEDFVSWLELCGTAFLKVAWNKNKGRIIFQGQQQQPAPITSGDNIPMEHEEDTPTPQPTMTEIREGDIETIVVPAHEIYPDSSYRRGLRDCRSIIHAKAYHVNEVEEIWGVRVEPEDVDVMTLQRMSSNMGGLGYGHGGVRTTAKPLKHHVVVKEYYERPTLKYPQGRFVVVGGKKTLYAGPLPYQLGRDGEYDLPFVRAVSTDRPGCFWGKSVLEACIPIQRRYNALRNRKAEYLNMISVGSWFAPIGSLDEGTELNNAPGNIIWYRPGIGGSKPEPVVWPSLPGSFEAEEQTLMQEFTAVSGVSELARFAQAPTGVRSGVALAAAAEQDDTRIATSISRVANASIDLGQKWIRLYRQFVQEPRLLRYIGGNREADVREWEMSDLRSDDVFIENMAALSETPGQRRQMVFDLLNAGLFVKPELSPIDAETRQKVFQMLEFGAWESGYEDDMFMQKSRARKENRDIMQGQPIMVQDFDDHQLHILQHNRMRMQSEYEELMATPEGPIINEMMMAHIAQHLQLALQAIPKEPVPPPDQQNPKAGSPKKDPKKG